MARRRWGFGVGRRAAALALLSVAAVSCSSRARNVVVSVQMLEDATMIAPRRLGRAILSNLAWLDPLYTPLGQRLGLFQVRSAAEWEALRQAAPELDEPPDFSRGMVVGLVSRTGMPLDGEWPITFELVRVVDGAGYVTASFHAGTYLPDATTYVELAQIEGLSGVLMVDVNGVRFYP